MKGLLQQNQINNKNYPCILRKTDQLQFAYHLYQQSKDSEFGYYAAVRTSGEDTQQHRRLSLWNTLRKVTDPKSVALKANENERGLQPPSPDNLLPNLAPYNLHNIMITPPAFTRELFLIYYDPSEDVFLVYVDETKDKYTSPVFSYVWNRIRYIMPILSHALRNHFADRFQGLAGDSPEFIAFFSSGDIPKLFCGCIQHKERPKHSVICQNDVFAPILQFGSVFQDATNLPNLVTMPVWSHLPYFRAWQREGIISRDINARAKRSAVSPSVWDTKLIPSIIWRGTDFAFLSCLNPDFSLVEWDTELPQILDRVDFTGDARGVTKSLLELWDNLSPRWRGITLSALAKLDAEEEGEAAIPWIDAKFVLKDKVYGVKIEEESAMQLYQPFEEHGVQITSESMTLSQLAQYKYQIDFGGGGGKIVSCLIHCLASA